MKRMLMAGLITTMLVLGAYPALAMTELSDHELDLVTAGTTVSSQFRDGRLSFQFQRETPSLSIDGEGTLATTTDPLPGGNSALIMRDSTTSLHGLLNVVAINSIVSVLMNLNVNINSTVGTVQQANGHLNSLNRGSF